MVLALAGFLFACGGAPASPERSQIVTVDSGVDPIVPDPPDTNSSVGEDAGQSSPGLVGSDDGASDGGTADGGVLAAADAATFDAEPTDAMTFDAMASDASAQDATPMDAATADASAVMDASAPHDAGPPDSGIHDAGFADAGFADAGFADAGAHDAGAGDPPGAGYDGHPCRSTIPRCVVQNGYPMECVGRVESNPTQYPGTCYNDCGTYANGCCKYTFPDNGPACGPDLTCVSDDPRDPYPSGAGYCSCGGHGQACCGDPSLPLSARTCGSATTGGLCKPNGTCP